MDYESIDALSTFHGCPAGDTSLKVPWRYVQNYRDVKFAEWDTSACVYVSCIEAQIRQ